ncbi:hypothetical protein GCM10010149_47770 [Nonomuraea roseoviolacea subsp. roseoviolacea]|uniref:hypothetical protein n=1 Tax=Nonomuraea roseoviolacea TaxID=103837 RepID=UPI0031DBFB22
MESSYRKNVAGRKQACKDLAELYEVGKLQEIRDWVEANAIDMGRTRQWKDSCRFVVDNYDAAATQEDPDRYRRWAILQGITYMNMYAK